MTGCVPKYPLVVHQGVVSLDFSDLVSFASLQLCWEWLELAAPGVTGYMKGSGLDLARRESDGITSLIFIKQPKQFFSSNTFSVLLSLILFSFHFRKL